MSHGADTLAVSPENNHTLTTSPFYVSSTSTLSQGKCNPDNASVAGSGLSSTRKKTGCTIGEISGLRLYWKTALQWVNHLISPPPLPFICCLFSSTRPPGEACLWSGTCSFPNAWFSAGKAACRPDYTGQWSNLFAVWLDSSLHLSDQSKSHWVTAYVPFEQIKNSWIAATAIHTSTSLH